MTIPISEFEHRVARWIEHLERTRKPLEVSQRGKSKIVVMDKETYDEWERQRELLQALEIKLLVEQGERDIAAGRVYTHEQVGEMFGFLPKKKQRKASKAKK